jgi:hypothetical protein
MQVVDGAVLSRFFAKVSKAEGDGCWLWTAAKVRDGYGLFSLSGKDMSAHRASWLIHRGEIPDGGLVLHHCDTPSCVRPDHLFLGSHSTNAIDREWKRRGGQRGFPRPLPSEKHLQIAADFYSGMAVRAVARKHGVAPGTVRNCIRKIPRSGFEPLLPA